MNEDESALRPLYTFVPNLKRAADRALSVYLPARAEGFDMRHYNIELAQLTRRYRDRLDKEEREIMERELLRLREHLQARKPARCPAPAAFRGAPGRTLELGKVPLETPARVGVRPLLLAP